MMAITNQMYLKVEQMLKKGGTVEKHFRPL